MTKTLITLLILWYAIALLFFRHQLNKPLPRNKAPDTVNVSLDISKSDDATAKSPSTITITLSKDVITDIMVSDDVVITNLALHLKSVVNRNITNSTSLEIAQAILKASHRFEVDPFLILGVIYAESNAKPFAVNGNCVGLMQVNPKYWEGQLKDAGIIHDQNDYFRYGPATLAGTYVLDLCLKRANNNIKKALTYYTGSVPKTLYMKKATLFLNSTNNTNTKGD